jgi:hypothetical protein
MLLVFSVWGSRVKSLCNLCTCVCHCMFSVFIKNLFALIYYTRLKSTFGIKDVIGFRGMPLCLRVWLRFVISLVRVGDLWY